MFRLALATLVVAACVAPEAGDPDGDPNLDDKADGVSATAKGVLGWSAPATVDFANDSGAAVKLVYVTFQLSGEADVTLQTQHASASSLDTVLYIYKPNDETWGRYLARDDDSGSGALSKITKHLSAGTYRVLVRRKTSTGSPSVDVAGTCSGDGCKRLCTPTEPRSAAPQLFVGPDNWQQNIEAAIDTATTTLDLQMYLFNVPDIATHLISAQQRGVAVRVLLDPSEASNNTKVQAQLTAAGIETKLDPATFSYAHAKYMIIDGARAVILSGNFNTAAVDTTGGGERNYGFVDHDPYDIADLESVYAADWSAGPEPDLSCTRLIVSPINSGQRILDHVNSAKSTLDIEVLYLEDTDLRAAVVAAKQRGVAVRIMLSDPARNPPNTNAQEYFAAAGIPTKFLITNYLHAKMIQADGVAMVGSENMSVTSWTKNREVGGLLFESTPAGAVHAQYEKDWAAAQ
jgi:cardiolipin synthase